MKSTITCFQQFDDLIMQRIKIFADKISAICDNNSDDKDFRMANIIALAHFINEAASISKNLTDAILIAQSQSDVS